MFFSHFRSLVFAAAFLFGFAPFAHSQSDVSAARSAKPSLQKVTSFGQLSPHIRDLIARKTGSNIDVWAAANDPCSMIRSIGYGQSRRGSLSSSDCQLPDGTYADLYLLEAGENQQIQLDMTSTDMDPYLMIFDESGDFMVEDDDGGGGFNARISVLLPHAGAYLILANSYAPEWGDYQLLLDKTPRCAFSAKPGSGEASPSGGTYSFFVDTETGCHWTARSPQRPHILLEDWYLGETEGYYGPRTIDYDITFNDSGSPFEGSILAGDAVYTVTQPALVCTYELDKYSLDFPAIASSQQVNLTTPVGCEWRGMNSSSLFGSDPWSGRGPATLKIFTYNNYGPTRYGTITVAGQVIEIAQLGLDCTYSLAATTYQVEADPQPGVIEVDTQPGCFSSIQSQGPVQFNNQAGLGPREITFNFSRNQMATPRSFTVQFHGGGFMIIPLTFHQAGAISQPVTVTGRVSTLSDDRAIRSVRIDLIDGMTGEVVASTISSSLGYFSFQDVPSGYGYLFLARSKRYRFYPTHHYVFGAMENISLRGME